MFFKYLFPIVFTILGSLLAAGYCYVTDISWVTFVDYNPPPGTEVTKKVDDAFAQRVASLPKGKTGHGISILGIPIEEEYDWGTVRPKEYHGIPGGRWTFIAFGGLTGCLLSLWLRWIFTKPKCSVTA